ncbi:MAG TPA: protein translocase subunit SecDF [Cyclobacteriaceae bacterium]|nr:protein translocase subunit SecDF [Cyclobacteriaceae bacterium]HMV10086.1 protein translocase subunit SecDF [Cyclobacteriaceae bacterium]HMV88639.1 protein translocase subunit SecDF [Cyclobacteriaceae bacterium]HMX00599.1 protein translocase subunit SecDF [Cyclobacteriaceae bacterium]HMX49526.1 protein translocase subunit SecDF [Cyclobacteriaceae bacterium]
MQNKGLVVILTVVISLLCFYYLSFTLISRSVQKDAVEYATTSKGEVDLIKKQAYLDSVWNKPVYNMLGIREYTYKEVKNSEISLGLDLQGGMHVTLEVSPVDIIRGLAGNSTDSAFVKTLNKTIAQHKTSQKAFADLFFDNFRKDYPNRKFASIFANASTRGRISLQDTDEQVVSTVNKEVEQAIDRSYTILSNRLDQFGTSQPNIQRLIGTERIQVEIPGAENPQRVRKLLQGAARLEFWDVVEPNTLNSSFIAMNELLVKEQKAKAKSATETTVKPDLSKQLAAPNDTSSLQNQLNNAVDSAAGGLDSLQKLNVSPLFALSKPAGNFRYELKDTAEINSILKRQDIKSLLPRNVKPYWANKAEKLGNLPEALELHFLDIGRNGLPRLTGEVIIDASNGLDQKTRPAVFMRMNAKGTREWAKWTRDAAQKHSRIAIVMDNYVYSAPGVNGEIPNGSSEIAGNFTTDEAKDLASVLKAGSLPAPTRIVEFTSVGSTLGQEAITNGLISIVAGFIVIIIFMFVVYSSAGWVADLAVILNLIFLLGVLASLNASLTLPGIAGILLSLAIAVDANVLINERVKEDLATGKDFTASVRAGYKNAFSAIIDSNVTTLIKGAVLLIFGSGLIYGFAVTLVIGILCSFFTSVFFTRVLFEALIKRRKSVSFSQAWSQNLFRSISINFIGNRKIYYAVSLSVIVAGMIGLAMKGLNYGVDFKGGRSYIVEFEKPVEASAIRTNLTATFGSAPEVKTYGSNQRYKITTDYLVEDDSETATVQAEQALETGLGKFEGNKSTVLSPIKVGPTIANDTKLSAIKSLTVAVVLMFLYILIRFRRWQFAMGTMISLVHTVLVVLSIFILLENVMPFSLEIDQAFIAAILTVIGYSINDSVVVFDRVREFLAAKRSDEDTPSVVNRALNDTLSRTLITGMSTIFVIIILFLFGGETIKGFTFAMLIGVLIGTYSSLCIGTPVLVDLSKKNDK